MKRAALALVLLLVGCGSRAAIPAKPQTFRLNWHETYQSNGERLVFAVSRLTVGRRRWSVRAAVTNGTKVALTIERAHRPRGSLFGLLLFRGPGLGDVVKTARYREPLQSTRFDPALPHVLYPGRTWSGTFSGPGVPSRNRYVRVEFGRFWGGPPGSASQWRGVIWITNHAVRLGGSG
jgi:hypothetical protein